MLKEFNRILFLDLRPWLIIKKPILKFKKLHQAIEELTYNHQPLYDVDWNKAINIRQAFYLKQIQNAGVDLLNTFQIDLQSIKDDREQNYLIHSKLTEIQFLMKEWSTFLLKAPDNKDVSFILDAIQHQLVRIYLEIQDAQNEELLSIDEVYIMLLNTIPPNPEKIIDAPVIELTITKPKVQQEKSFPFVAVMDDFRPYQKGILPYEVIIKNAKRFAEAELDLYLKGFIDVNYNFTHKHGLKNEMAKMYHSFISNGYFSPRDFENLKDIKPRDIRKFLDLRYNVNLDKQFRTVG